MGKTIPDQHLCWALEAFKMMDFGSNTIYLRATKCLQNDVLRKVAEIELLALFFILSTLFTPTGSLSARPVLNLDNNLALLPVTRRFLSFN